MIQPGLIKMRTSLRLRFAYLTACFKEKPLSGAKAQVKYVNPGIF